MSTFKNSAYWHICIIAAKELAKTISGKGYKTLQDLAAEYNISEDLIIKALTELASNTKGTQ